MDILEIGTQLIQEKFGVDLESGVIADALGNLLGAESGTMNVQDFISQFTSDGGLQNIVTSWLGDGANSALSVDQLTNILGGEKIAEFSSQLGIDQSIAADGLTEVIPQMIDKMSSGGSLLEGVADVGGMLDFAKKLF